MLRISLAPAAARFALALCLALLAACAATPQAVDTAPAQSPNDRFAYRLVTLDNGLKALLVSNPDTAKAAASLDVYVGSGDNPEGRGGLAHFLEHMLFLGTEKYPDAAEYERFITEHGGSRNAYTSFEHTNYFFDIDAPHLNGAMDRFAQFFISPNFDARYVERERNAVEAEYQMGLKSDPRRGLDVLQASMNPEHPYSQFAVGSLESLADRPDSAVRDELIRFYEARYSANLMRLAVLGSESLDELEVMVTQMFASVPNRDAALEPIEEPLFVDAQLPMLLRIEPQGTRRMLEVNFQVPDYRAQYRAKPMSYISNLVGHEGEGSLLSELKREGLADALAASTGLYWRGGALFSVNVSLTEKGVAEYEAVLQRLFAYLAMLRERGPQGGIYLEQAALADLAFRFREPSSPMGYVSNLSNNMHYYADADILQGPYLMSDFSADTISQALARLTPDQAQVVLTAPGVSTDRTSPYYAVPYAQLGPEALVLSRWRGFESELLHLPKPNPFIAENVELVPLAEDGPARPVLSVDETRKRIWYQQDTEFRVPKGALYASFRSPQVGGTARKRAAAALYTRMVTDALNEFTYPALLAGLGFDFYQHAQGISLRVSGYNDKQLRLLGKLLEGIATQDFDRDRFERLRREMVRELQNTIARRPTSQLLDDLRRAVVSGQFDEPELIAALEELDVASLNAFRSAFWESARVEALLYGNHPRSAVRALSATLDTVLSGGSGEPASAPEVLKIVADRPMQLQVSIEHDDAVVAWYLQGEGQGLADRAAVALTAQVARSGFFQQLRTEQQLGYIVSSFAWPQYDVPGLLLLVQSPSHSAADVYRAMDSFLADTLEQITEEQFLRHRQALVNDILKPDENLRERAEFYWQSIAIREWDFDSDVKLAQAVEAMSFAEWQAYYQRLFLGERRSLLALSPGAQGALPPEEVGEVFDAAESIRTAGERYLIDLRPL